jgi:Ca-activated chloride channel family protein
MKKSLLPLLLLLLLAALVAPRARAQDQIPQPRLTEVPIPLPPNDRPICIDFCPPPVWNMDGLEIPYQRVTVTIADQVATTRVEQLFRNPNEWLLEGTYYFPLPPGAAVSQLTMWVDGLPIEAKLMPAGEARAVYDAIVRQLRDPALLEYVGQDAIQANVFPIPPGEERLIEIEYTTLLTADNGAFRYVYPQSAGVYSDTPPAQQSIRVALASDEAIRTLYSPSHRVSIARDGEFRATVGYEAAHPPLDDFELYYTVSPEEIGLNLLSYQAAGEDGFFVLLVAPGIAPGEVVAKDVILVLDTSGSMEGEKIVQARSAARYVVEHLNPDDRFAVVDFNTTVNRYAPALLPANEAAAAAAHIDGLFAAGGTNISGALLEAAALVGPERPTTIIFLTDGLATEGITDTPLLLENVAAALPANARLFAFGVGDDVDTTLLDTLAQNHRGATTYVRPGQAIDETVSAFYARVGAPVLTDIAIDFGGVAVHDVYPLELPDLFAGTQLVVAGRYRAGGPATITLSGTTNGRPQSFTYADQTFRAAGGEAFIPRLWATRAIGHLMQQIRLRGEDAELVQSVVALSTRYGIITPYTSFLIEEDDIAAQSNPQFLEEAAAELAAPDAVSGAAAVERADTESDLAAAEAPLPMATMTVADGAAPGAVVAEVPVQTAGDRTFFLRSGVWVDSAYDAAAGEPAVIPFASDAYFELLSARPELGAALALGEEVLVVVDGAAYRITSQGTVTDTVTLPASTPESGQPIAQSDEVTPAPFATPTGETATPSEDGMVAFGVGVPGCASALLLPLLAVFGLGWSRRRR